MGAKHKRLSDRAFGLAFGTLFLLIFVVGSLVFGRPRTWALPVSASFVLIALLAPGILMPLNRVWTLIGERITAVLNLVLLLTSYALVILPLGLIMKMRGRDALRLSDSTALTTYWSPPVRPITKESFQEQF